MLNILNVAQSGLNTAQTQVENVMNNIANEHTKGYKKRIVNVSEIAHSDSRLTGRGVLIDSVSRVTDSYMYDRLVTEEAKFNDVKTLNSMLSNIESIFHETKDTGLSADINRYFKSIENLKTSPSNPIYKQDLKNNAKILTTNLKELYDDIENLEKDTIKETKTAVKEINNILNDIGSVSKKITESSVPTNDLYDKRDQLEKELAKYIDVEISREETYELKIGGVTAIRFDTNVREINLVEKYTPQQDAYLKLKSDGTTVIPHKSNLVDSTWGSTIGATSTQEIQNINLSGKVNTTTGTDSFSFLGRTFTVDNSDQGGGVYNFDTAAEVTDHIVANLGSLIADWNTANPTKEIASITQPYGAGTTTLQITYANTEGNVSDITKSISNGLTFSDSIEMVRGGVTSTISEVQTLEVTGTTTDPAYFLGTAITGSVAGETAAQTATRIAADVALGFDPTADATGQSQILWNWNTNPDNANKQIEKITADATGNLTITYKSHMNDVDIMESTSSRGINYARSEETTKGSLEDSITYRLNDTHQITVTHGEIIYEADGITPADINNDGVADAADIVDKDNLIQALVYKINQDNDIGGTIKAYNGKYEIDKDGNKIEMNNPLHSKYTAITDDHYLFIESNIDGEKGSFVGEIIVNDNANVDAGTKSYYGKTVSKENNITKEAIDDIHLEIFGKEIKISAGMLKPMIDNIKTDSGNNKFSEYKDMLDNFAKKLSDFSSDFIETSSGKYVYGLDATQVDASGKSSTNIGLFQGSSVKTLQFQETSVNNLNQEKLDYLASIQWKDDIDFDGSGEGGSSFSKYYQTLRVTIADSRENVIFNQESQEAIKESIQSTYEELTKVDKDAEMIDLIKYQSGYQANAKVITIIDEMLQTLLGIKR